MGLSYIGLSAVCTILSYVTLHMWTESSVSKLNSEGLIHEDYVHAGNVGRVFELLLGSNGTIALLANFVLNVFVLLVLVLKTIFFTKLYPSETRKLVERLINYVIYKGTFLPLVVPPTVYHAGLWSIWLIVLCCLKMFQALARDRLERLNASPSATPWMYFRVYSVLLLVFFVDILWIQLCFLIYRMLGLSVFLLLLYEPLSIAFETLQAMLVHGFQLLDIWLHHSSWSNSGYGSFKFFDISVAVGSLLEWKGMLTQNVGFSLDMATLLMALGHYVHIWWLHGMAFQLVEAILFLNIRALLSAIVKRVKGFMKLRKALRALHAALPDATPEELRDYNDECAICREPMAKAKKLHCSHLFHLACLRSWLDQCLNDAYSCPTCRKPLFVGRPENMVDPASAEISRDEQLAWQLSLGLDPQNISGNALPTGVFPNQMQLPTEGSPWRSTELDSSWLHPWSNQGVDGAGPSTAARSVGSSRVQMMMRHLASIGENYAQTAFEDTSWSLFPMNSAQATATVAPIPPAIGGRFPGATGGLHRTTSSVATDDIDNILAMAERVREVLPYVPYDIIFRDLQRTDSVAVTVNNLLQT